MAVSRVALKSGSYEENIKSFISEIKGQKELTDVTLVSGDGQHLEAHRMILSAFSPLLRAMFGQKSKSPNTLVFLRSVSSKCMVAMVDFMYLGEVNILEENLQEFLDLAKDLQIKGLADEEGLVERGVPQKLEKETDLIRTCKNFDNFDDTEQHQLTKDMNIKPKKENTEEERTQFVTTEENTDVAKSMKTNGAISLQGLEEILSNLMVKIEGGFSCKNCDKQTFGSKHGRSQMKRHIEAKHITDLDFSCPHCGQNSPNRDSVARHIMRKHKMQ